MTISTRATLETAISTWMVRSDLTSLYGDFIQFGEIELNAGLRLLQQEVVVPVSVSLSQNAQTATLPTNFLEPISLLWSDIDGGPIQRSVGEIAAMLSSTTGRPDYFAYSSSFFFDRPAGQAYTLKSRHFEKWALGSGSSDTNWLLTNAPDAYLYAALAAAGSYARNPKDPAETWEGKRDRAVARLNRIDARSRKGAALTSDVALLSRRGSGYDINRG